MNLSNTLREDNLVVLKEGVSTFNYGTGLTEFKPNTFYRAIQLENENHKEVLIYGEVFINEGFDDRFETAQTRILRDFATLGIIVDGEVISKTAFGKLLQIHQYGRGRNNLKIGYVMTHPKELMYAFFPNFRGETKATTIDVAYQNALDIIDGHMACVDEYQVQFGNCGIPIGATDNTKLRVRDTTKDLEFTI